MRKANKKVIDIIKNPEPGIAVREGNVNLLLTFIRDDPKIIHKKRFPSGWTLLHRAAELGQTDICQVLLQYGASVHDRTTWGWFTPLHLALGNGWKETSLFLMHAGADLTKKSKCQKDVIEYATHRGFETVAKEFYFIVQYEREVKFSQANKKAKEKLKQQQQQLEPLQELEEQSLADSKWGGEGEIVEVTERIPFDAALNGDPLRLDIERNTIPSPLNFDQGVFVDEQQGSGSLQQYSARTATSSITEVPSDSIKI